MAICAWSPLLFTSANFFYRVMTGCPCGKAPACEIIAVGYTDFNGRPWKIGSGYFYGLASLIRDALVIIPAVINQALQVSKPKKPGWQHTS